MKVVCSECGADLTYFGDQQFVCEKCAKIYTLEELKKVNNIKRSDNCILKAKDFIVNNQFSKGIQILMEDYQNSDSYNNYIYFSLLAECYYNIFILDHKYSDLTEFVKSLFESIRLGNNDVEKNREMLSMCIDYYQDNYEVDLSDLFSNLVHILIDDYKTIGSVSYVFKYLDPYVDLLVDYLDDCLMIPSILTKNFESFVDYYSNEKIDELSEIEDFINGLDYYFKFIIFSNESTILDLKNRTNQFLNDKFKEIENSNYYSMLNLETITKLKTLKKGVNGEN